MGFDVTTQETCNAAISRGSEDASAAIASPKQTATHFALSALSQLLEEHPDVAPSEEGLREGVKKLVGSLELDEDSLSEVVGEL